MYLLRNNGFSLVALSFTIVASACTIDEKLPSAPAASISTATERKSLVAAPEVDFARFARRARKDTPWQAMGSAELARSIENLGGRAIIGVKDPLATAGVDEDGHILAARASVTAARLLLESAGGKVLRVFDGLPVIVVDLPRGAGVVAALRAHGLIDYIEADGRGELLAQTVPWNISRVQGPQAWSYASGNGVKLLILDTGVGSHQDVSPGVSFRCVDASEPVTDEIGHGTGVAGVAAALDNSADVVGLAKAVTLWSADVTVAGTSYVSAAEIACAIDIGRINGVFAVNMSIHLFNESTAVNDALAAGYGAGMFFAAAAGNNGYYSGAIDYPATRPEVVAVGAVDASNVVAQFSSFGAKLELSAPGVGVLSTAKGPLLYQPNVTATTGSMDGTSVSSPHVTAAAALLKSYNPSWSNIDIRTRLNVSAQYLGDPTFYGNGLVRTKAALIVY